MLSCPELVLWNLSLDLFRCCPGIVVEGNMLPLKPLRMVRVRSDWSEQPWATLREEGPVEIMKSPPDLTVTEIGQSAISASRVADTVMEFNPTAIVSSARTV